jgi:hypothetical protein
MLPSFYDRHGKLIVDESQAQFVLVPSESDFVKIEDGARGIILGLLRDVTDPAAVGVLGLGIYEQTATKTTIDVAETRAEQTPLLQMLARQAPLLRPGAKGLFLAAFLSYNFREPIIMEILKTIVTADEASLLFKEGKDRLASLYGKEAQKLEFMIAYGLDRSQKSEPAALVEDYKRRLLVLSEYLDLWQIDPAEIDPTLPVNMRRVSVAIQQIEALLKK